MMECADSTTLRAHLDEADAALDDHLDECADCAGLLRSIADDAGYAQRALDVLAHGDDAAAAPDTEAALASVVGRAPAPVVALEADRRHTPIGRRLLSAAAAVVVVLVATVTPAGRTALAQALDAFRGERLQPIVVDMAAWGGSLGPEDARALSSLGDLDTSGLSEPERVTDVAAAEAVAGIDAPTFSGTPDRIIALAPGTVRLVLASREGNGVPRTLDGAALVVDVPGAVGAVLGPAGGPPEIVIGRSGQLVVRSEGAPLEDIRAFILSREELPAGLRAQLTAIDDWRSTVPVPVPLDGPGWKEVELDGRQAIAFGDDTGLGALVIRQDAGGVTVVGGRIGIERALALAADA